MFDTFRRFFEWWGRSLLAALPQGLKGAFATAEERIDVVFEGDRLALLRNGARLEPDESKRFRKSARRTTLLLPSNRTLAFRVDLPTSAAENIDMALAAEMPRQTPFAIDDVAYDYSVAGVDTENERLLVDVWAARKADVAAAQAAAARAGLGPNRIAPLDDLGVDRGRGNLLAPAKRVDPSASGRRLLKAAFFVAVLLGVAWIGLAFHKLDEAVAVSEDRLTELQRSARSARSAELRGGEALTALNAIAAAKSARPQTVEILDALSARLPDSVWLTDFKLADDAIVIEGFADDSAAVLTALERSNLFSGAAFIAPVQIDPRGGKERFRAEASIRVREDGA